MKFDNIHYYSLEEIANRIWRAYSVGEIKQVLGFRSLAVVDAPVKFVLRVQNDNLMVNFQVPLWISLLRSVFVLASIFLFRYYFNNQFRFKVIDVVWIILSAELIKLIYRVVYKKKINSFYKVIGDTLSAAPKPHELF